MFRNIDDYTLQARVAPVLLAVFPLSLYIASFFSSESIAIGLVTGLLAISGLGPLIAQLGRDSGRLKEAELYKEWGGKPTTRLFRFNGSDFDSLRVSALHKNMKSLLSDDSCDINEVDAPEEADKLYSRWTDYLREATRDKVAFPVVYAENINYGFRRNLYGLKRVGICFSILIILAILFSHFFREASVLNKSLSAMEESTIVVSVIMVYFYMFIIKKNWVKIAADAYAKSILLASDKLVSDKM